MARMNALINAFGGGLIGKRLGTRVDLQKYPQGAEVLENFRPSVQGTMSRRPPMIHVDTLADKKGKLIKFVHDQDNNFMIDATDHEFTFYQGDQKLTVPAVTATIQGGEFDVDLAYNPPAVPPVAPPVVDPVVTPPDPLGNTNDLWQEP